MSEDKFRSLRIAIVGSCQVAGLASAAGHLLPGAEVKAWHAGVNPKDTDEEILAQLTGYDVVISQMPDWDERLPLRIGRLLEQGIPAVYMPVMMFSGFHPDITYIRSPDGTLRPGLNTDYHSVIVAAAFTLGLPEHRVLTLFNPFVFAELGYFEVFEAAKSALFKIFGEAGYDLTALFDEWMRKPGQFMYTINHPHILVLAALCQLAIARAGHLDLSAALPENIDDSLATHFIWPIYPALARKMGLPGSTTFLRNAHNVTAGQSRELTLPEYISACYRIYGDLEKDSLRVGVVATACDRLRAFVVA